MVRWAIAGAAIVAGATMLTGCGAADGARRVSLASLAGHQEGYDGVRVKTRGRVRAFADPGGQSYFVIEDSEDNRVKLVPNGIAGRYGGSVVDVTGCFTAGPTAGRTLRLSEVVRIGAGTPHRSEVATGRACVAAVGPVPVGPDA